MSNTQSKSEHVERIEQALEEINHLRYSEVSEGTIGHVAVRIADDVENRLVNNGEWAAFREAGYVGVHIEYDENELELRFVGDV